jgi:tetratricopeptide (TPR) repeat protein
VDPNLAEAHAIIGVAKSVIGRFEETESHIEEAIRLSPRDKYFSAWLVIACIAQLYLGNDDKAVTCFRAPLKSVEIIPELNITLPAPWRSSVGWRKRDPRFERLCRSTQTSPSRASTRAQGVTTHAIWPRVSDYATASA